VKRHLILFAKAPKVGTVKSRLAKDIGLVPAWRFYEQTLRQLITRLSNGPGWSTSIAVTPDEFVPEALRVLQIPDGVSVVPQGAGDLGIRMAGVLDRYPGMARILVGVDIPAIQAAHIDEAFDRLSGTDLIFGPAVDGGFWLVGSRLPRLPTGLFDNVHWSTAHALADTLKNVPATARVSTASTLADVDDKAALTSWEASQDNEQS
jgi:rSAM/selenodomain-associated transferase 1